MASKPFSIHNCIYSNSMGICSGRSSNNNYFPSKVHSNIIIYFLSTHSPFIVTNNMNVLIIYRMNAASINNVKSKLFIQSLCSNNIGIGKAHFH